MMQSRGTWLAIGLAVGLVVGLNLGGYWPQVPIHAHATHGQDNFAICTGTIDPEIEAVYLLDYVTGDLKAAVLSINTRMFNTYYSYNISKDFSPNGIKNPRYLMVSGFADMRRSVAVPIGQGVIYIAEMTSGQVACYGLPWSPGRQSSNAPVTATVLLLDKLKFRTTAIRGAGAEQ
jgi:hypothetical protein